MSQELLTTFQSELGEVALVPGTGGVFEVRIDGTVVWSRAVEGRFPELKELKQRVRDVIAPGRSLGSLGCVSNRAYRNAYASNRRSARIAAAGR